MNTVGILSAHIRHCSMLVATCLILSTTMAKAEPITEQQANAIGVDAYLYFYSLVTMDLTRKQLTNVETGKGIRWADEHLRERPSVSNCAGSSCRSAQFRYSLFVGVA